ncbi:MAG: hypothetical protein DMF78_00005, partial [Acidobacteria bacterium]
MVGPDGKPVVGALVSVQAALLYGYPEPAVTARTDAAGRFRVPVKTAAAQTVRVEAPGLAARLLPRVRPGEPVRIALDKGGSIEGVVRDGTTGEPAAAITVEARQEATRGVGMVWEPGAGLVRATTDAQGRFRLDGLAAGLHTLAARGRGVSGARRGIGIGKRAEIYVFPGSGLHATVSGPDGRAVAGAKVALENATPFGGRSADVQVSDARGRIEFVGIDPGVYRVVARHPDFAPAWTTVTVERSGDATADLTLAPPAAIVGRLVGAEDRPVRGRVAVAETDGAAPPPFSLAPTLAVETAEDGRFRLDTVPPGSYVLSATAPGYGARRAEAVVGGTQRVTDVGDITLETGLVIRGHVREAGGAPIADARVGVFRFPPTGGDDRAEGRSAADGSFALGGLRAGGYRVTVNAPGHGMANREVDAPAEGVDFVLDAAGSLTGMVVDERGRPVETIRVQARVPPAPSGPGGASGGQFGTMMFSMGGAPAAPAPAGPQRMTAVTRDDGSYEMLVDEPGKGTVSVSTFDGSASYPSQPVEFPDADTFTFDIALPAASIAGVVVDRET